MKKVGWVVLSKTDLNNMKKLIKGKEGWRSGIFVIEKFNGHNSFDEDGKHFNVNTFQTLG